MPFVFLFALGCNTQNRESEPKNIVKIDSLGSQVIGDWGGFNEGRPAMRITKDSILYFVSSKSYPYQINNHNLIIDCFIDYGRYDTMGNIRFNKDTMFYLLDGRLNARAHKFK